MSIYVILGLLNLAERCSVQGVLWALFALGALLVLVGLAGMAVAPYRRRDRMGS